MGAKTFLDIINGVVEQDGLITQEFIADETGLSQSTISGYVNRKSKKPRPANMKKVILTILKFTDFTSEQDLENRYSPVFKIPAITTPPPVIETPTLKETPANVVRYKKNPEHHDIVDRFKNAELMLRINQKLLTLEELESPLVYEIEKQIDMQINAAIQLKFEREKKNLGETKAR